MWKRINWEKKEARINNKIRESYSQKKNQRELDKGVAKVRSKHFWPYSELQIAVYTVLFLIRFNKQI